MTENEVSTGFDLDAIRAELDSQDWEEDWQDSDTEVRRVYLGTVFALTPSGKYYTPFACGNVDPCPVCSGDGRFQPICREDGHDCPDYGDGCQDCHVRAQLLPQSDPCEYCGGLGSREAYLDQLWQELAEQELDTIGACLEHGEGDPCDLFAVEYKDRE